MSSPHVPSSIVAVAARRRGRRDTRPGTLAAGCLSTCAGLLIAGPCAAATIIPVDQHRAIAAQVVYPDCGAIIIFDAPDAFEPFGTTAQIGMPCGPNGAHAVAGQDSQIDPAAVSAIGTASFDIAADPDQPGQVDTMGVSYFRYTFELLSTGRVSVTGSLEATSSEGHGSSTPAALVTLSSDAAESILHAEVPATAGGSVLAVDESVLLEPGVYTLLAQALGTFGGAPPRNTIGRVDYDLTIQIEIVGDLDADQHVTVTDLMALFSAWGPCAGGCAADLNADGMVDVTDVAIMLGNWG